MKTSVSVRALIPLLSLVAALFVPAGCGKEGPVEGVQEKPAAVERTTAPASTEESVGEVPPSEPGDPEAGKVLFEKHCHFCHGREGRGDGPVGIAVTPHPADFVGDTERMEKSDLELFESITNGVVKELGGDEMAMPAWKGILTPKQRWDLVAYIRHLSRVGVEKNKKSD